MAVKGCWTKGPVQLLAELYLNPKDSDFYIVVGDVNLPVHRCILAPQSNFFRDMIYSTLNTGGQVDFSTHSVDVVKGMLSWIYKQMVDNMGAVCKELLPFAQMCELYDLASACGLAMVKQLSVANVFEMFEFAKLHQVDTMKKDICRFLVAHKAEVFESDEWKQLRSSNATLAGVIETMMECWSAFDQYGRCTC